MAFSKHAMGIWAAPAPSSPLSCVVALLSTRMFSLPRSSTTPVQIGPKGIFNKYIFSAIHSNASTNYLPKVRSLSFSKQNIPQPRRIRKCKNKSMNCKKYTVPENESFIKLLCIRSLQLPGAIADLTGCFAGIFVQYLPEIRGGAETQSIADALHGKVCGGQHIHSFLT